MRTSQDTLERIRHGFAALDVSEELSEQAVANLELWLADEQFAEARPQLLHLLGQEDFNTLFDCFFQQIPFGTGGRRGPVGFGTNRVNLFTIATSIQGHCEFLRRHQPQELDRLAVVVAFDVRVFNDLRRVYSRDLPNPLLGKSSRDFARAAACVYAANGVRVWFPHPEAPHYLSTPELSFAIRYLEAHGGLNISASHNHPDDNGAKIYNRSGGQEVPPLDEEMARIVEDTTTARSMPWDEAMRAGLIRWIPARVHESYVRINLEVGLAPGARSARIVFTPLHGTGWSSVGEVLTRAGFDVQCFPDQAEPDGLFPNVPFRSPNPEVPESLEGATRFARETEADLVLATDPDADRLGAVAPRHGGGWSFLTGNEIGAVLAAYLLGRRDVLSRRRDPFAVTTVVTTSLFRRIASARGVQTLADLPIGFKYIAQVLNRIEAAGTCDGLRATIDDFVLGIEESHGYLVTPRLRDKDAAGAALLLAELASQVKDAGRTLLDFLDGVYREFGYVRNLLRSTVLLGARGFIAIHKIQRSLRDSPPERIGELRVLRFTDRWDASGPYGPILSETDRAARDILTFELEKDARLVLRPSGTESKNKLYVEVCGGALGPNAPPERLLEEKREVDALAGRVAEDFLLAMLGRIGVALPRYALAVSDLVPLEWKQDFALRFLPELLERIAGGGDPAVLGTWADERLRPYGADGRLLVRRAIQAYLESERPPAPAATVLARLFALEER